MDRCIQAQLAADAAAAGRGTQTIKVSHEEAEYTRRVYTDEMEYVMFQSWWVSVDDTFWGVLMICSFEDVVRASNGELPFHVDGEIPRTD